MVGKFLLGMVSGGLVVTGGLVVGSMLFPTQPANVNAPVAVVEEPIAAPEATTPDVGGTVTASADPEPTVTDAAPATVEPEPAPEATPAPDPAPEAMGDAVAPLVSDEAPAAPQDDTASVSAAPEVPAATDVAQPETSEEPSKPAADASDLAPATATLEATPSEPAADAVSAPDELQIADAGTETEAPAAPDAAPKAAASDTTPAPAEPDPATPAPASAAVVAPGDAPDAVPAEPAPAEAAPATEVADAGTDQQPVATGTANVTDPAAEAAVTQAPASDIALAEAELAEAAPDLDAPAPEVTTPEATAPAAEDAEAATVPAATDTATAEPDAAAPDPAAIAPEAAPETVPETVPEAAPEAMPEDAPAAEPIPAEDAPSDPMAVPATDAGTAVTDMPGTKPSALPGAVEPEADTGVAVAEDDSGSKTFKPSPGLVRAGEGVIIGRNQPSETTPTDPASDPAAEPLDPRPIAQFAAEFENPDAKPPFAIVLVDPGTPDLDRAGLAALPFPVSFALDPLDPATPERAAIYRAAGREVVMLVTGIAQGAQASDVEVAFQSMEQGLPEAVAAMDLANPIFQNNRGLASTIVPILQASGRGLLTWDEGLNAADQVARREDLDAAVVFRNLDLANGDTVAIRRLLDRAVFKADQDRRVSVVGTADAATVAALLEWSVEGKAATVALAPLTAVLQVD